MYSSYRPTSNGSTGSQSRRVDPFEVLDSGGIAPPSPEIDFLRGGLDIDDALDKFEKQYFPRQPKSLAGIATRAFATGIVFSLSAISTIYILLGTTSPLWRVPFFIAGLALFHFLEFWTTAAYNTPSAQTSSFLFTGNGSAYTIAHTAATLEGLISNTFFPHGALFSSSTQNILLGIGLFLMLLGQTIRSIAMIEAGTNFNHIVQHTKSQSHKLVTTGLYAYFRHPSYFGFFWWGLGTQLVLGNAICFVGYAFALWRFFSRRIPGEEQLLISFFGDDYVQYRKRTSVGIPFIS